MYSDMLTKLNQSVYTMLVSFCELDFDLFEFVTVETAALFEIYGYPMPDEWAIKLERDEQNTLFIETTGANPEPDYVPVIC